MMWNQNETFHNLFLCHLETSGEKKFFFRCPPSPLVGVGEIGILMAWSFSAPQSRITYISFSVLSKQILLNYMITYLYVT